ncbi:S1C family serine protease [Vaginisenegalia massiliensis]|uniref:S1C family serine protease n=1 Tax=Vaginisenegalia massiliensis TaxID=2058294 RepID=UPI000F53FE47|nr:trypsin-like peptidase domain-containing protein [Vaginisenegalia massiliensis]
MQVNEEQVQETLPLASKVDTSKVTLWKGFVGGLLGSFVILGIFLFLFGGQGWKQSVAYTQNSQPHALAVKTSPQASKTLNDFETAILGAVERTKGAVVSIGNLQDPKSGDLFGSYSGQAELPDPNANLEVVGEGSGVIYKIEGNKAYIVTNNHVIDGNKALQVIMADGQKVDAKVLGSDQITDLAVVTIDAKYAKNKIEFANSDNIKVGSLAIAIGSPLGSHFASSVTQGIVSGLNRSMPVDVNQDGVKDWTASLLQTDAAINPGNSGGALVNKDGQLIGINSNKFSSTGIEGMGFAIPSNEVKTIIDQLEKNGKVTRPVLGISSVDVNLLSDHSRIDILQLDPEQTSGVAIRDVESGSSAEKAGLKGYDVIIELDGKKIEDTASLRNVLYNHKEGDKIEVKYLRQGKEAQTTVSLQAPKEELNSGN